MLDKTITSALVTLRLQMIRSGSDLAHVDALLIGRGIDPASLHVPRQYPADSCGHGEIKLMVLGLLREGPRTAAEIVAAFHAGKPDMSLKVARLRVWRAIYKMGRSGVMAKDGNAWNLRC
jgi:hypothetical protein